MFAEAEENNLDDKVQNERLKRWYTCSLCEQQYHGVVACALGWACWKTYVGRPEADFIRGLAISVLGNGLSDAKHHKDALTVGKAELSMMRRLGATEENVLAAQSNLAITYQQLRRDEEALSLRRDAYSGNLRLYGEDHEHTLQAANNYANSILNLYRFEETKSLLRKTIPVARRVLGEGDETTLTMRWNYAEALVRADNATVGDLREAVTTLEDVERVARRVLGGAHPLTVDMELALRNARAALRAREMPSPPGTE